MQEEKRELAIGESIRQGDVLLTRVAELPYGHYNMSETAYNHRNRKGGLFPKGNARLMVLAEGEKTGHTHKIECKEGYYSAYEAEAFGPMTTASIPTHLRVRSITGHGVFMAHQEHGKTNIPDGVYNIKTQNDKRGPIGRRTGGYGD
jgi:hypothetical protein